MPLNVFAFDSLLSNDIDSFEPSCVRPRLATGGMRTNFLKKSVWNEFLLQRVGIGHPYFFLNHFYEENKHGIVKSICFSLLQ